MIEDKISYEIEELRMKPEILMVLAVWNVITFFMMGLDKHKAKHQRQRISEKALLLSAFAFGSAGSILGAFLFRHKTKKLKFQIALPCAVIFQVAVILFVIFR